jgi:hypothetical protein
MIIKIDRNKAIATRLDLKGTHKIQKKIDTKAGKPALVKAPHIRKPTINNSDFLPLSDHSSQHYNALSPQTSLGS